jgi:hypothetical protein
MYVNLGGGEREASGLEKPPTACHEDRQKQVYISCSIFIEKLRKATSIQWKYL